MGGTPTRQDYLPGRKCSLCEFLDIEAGADAIGVAGVVVVHVAIVVDIPEVGSVGHIG